MLVVKMYITLIVPIISGIINSIFCKTGALSKLKKNNNSCINALMKDDNIDVKYAYEKVIDQYEYVLLEKKIK